MSDDQENRDSDGLIKVCSCCHKEREEVGIIVDTENKTLKNVTMCAECLENNLGRIEMNEEMEFAINDYPERIISSKEMEKSLSFYVRGQEEAVSRIAFANWRHATMIEANRCLAENPDEIDEGIEDVQKVNILIIGPTGCGKTFIAEQLSQEADKICYVGDATTITPDGYHGESVDTLLTSLFLKAGQDLRRAERGVLVLDESDKIAGGRYGGEEDLTTKGVQDALLTIMNGGDTHIPTQLGGKGSANRINFSTKELLFIGLGAFSGLEEIIAKRLGKNNIGFGSKNTGSELGDDKLMKKVKREDLIKYGLTKEFVGRLHTIIVCNKLSREVLTDILANTPMSPIKQWQRMLSMHGKELIFDESAISAIVDLAIEEDTGARSLPATVEDVMFKAVNNLEDYEKDIIGFKITSDTVKNGIPEFIYEKEEDELSDQKQKTRA